MKDQRRPEVMYLPALTKPDAESAGVAVAAWPLSRPPVVRSKYPAIVADPPRPCYAKMQFLRACGNSQDKPHLTGPFDIQIYKVMAISPRLFVQMVVLLWP